MSKGQRNRAQHAAAANGYPHTGAPAEQVFAQFPYERKFTADEVADILERAKAFGNLMRDGRGPNGAYLFIPGDVFELWMIHGVLAGADGGTKYIRPRRLPDANGRLADAVEWVLIKEDTDAKRREDAEREAAAYVAAIDEQLRPEVAAAIRRRLVDAGRRDAEARADNDSMARDAGRDFGAPRLIQYNDDDNEGATE